MTKKVAIIGAGPAGITAGYELAKKGIGVDVYESSDSVGGMAKSLELWGQIVDIGPHRFFSSDNRVNSLWLEVVGNDYEMVDRLTRIFYKKKFFNYPIKIGNALKNLGFIESARCMISYFLARLGNKYDLETFEGWVSNRFGKRLFQIFFKTYTEKLWGISCKELDADFAAQRIKKLSLWGAVINAIKGGKGNKHKTLVDQFAYPVNGTGMVYNRMKDYIENNGGVVYLNTPVEKVISQNNKAIGIKLESGKEIKYDRVISSMPLTVMVNRLSNVPQEIKKAADNLSYRNTVIVYLNIEDRDLFPDNWLYMHSPDINLGRVTNFRNWVPSINRKSKNTILALEYWSNDDGEIWNMDNEKLIEMAKKEIRHTTLVKDQKILEGYVYRIHRCYPVYKTGYKKELKPVEDYVKTISNLSCVGRYGAFKYNNQDHSILMGILAAENIVQDKNIHNLWDINTDYDSYQEESVITKTGLQKK